MNIIARNYESLTNRLCDEGKYEPDYLLMNEDTLKFFELDWGSCNNKIGYPAFYGKPIAICNKLPIGEVKLLKEIK